MKQREATLEILRLRNQRAYAEIAYLRDDSNFVTNRGSSLTSSDINATPQPTPLVPPSDVRSSTIVKQCESDIFTI